MAGLMVGGAFLGSFLNVVFDRLASPEFVNLIHGKKLDSKLIRRLETTLRVVRAALNDAEKKQIRDPDVNYWLNDLKDAVYVTDDLLDEISTKAVLNDAEKKQFGDSDVNNWLNDGEMVSKLEDIVERLEYVLKLKESLDLKEIAVENLSHGTPSTSLQDGSHVYGRDKDKEAIIKLLLDDNGDGEEVSVIPIVGMGGVGKTTLAQLVYNDESLKNIFNLKAWVCVSDKFDILKVTKIITEEVTGKPCEMDNLNLLHLNLQATLKEKKFLIVLDDVWIEDYVNWDLLKKPIQRGVRGSKILVTTRSANVADVVQTVQTYNLNQLSNEDCWLVFAKHACFPPRSSGNTAPLEKIGREIVKKCAGLPLAAKSLGGILRTKHDIRDWEKLLKNDIWESSESESESNILPALRVSYHYLPPHLKRCFVYCSLYPKDYPFEKDDVILLWMAEDLLPPPRKGKTLEEVGCEYFDYLVARSFLQRSRYSSKVVMHDLLHDLATFLGGEFYFRSEDLGVETKISIKTRHLSFTKFSGLLEKFEALGTAKFLRTFLPMRYVGFNDDGEAAWIILSKLKHLRVLSFCWFGGLNVLPDSIGELIHLRYLDLSGRSIMALPESLGNLYNLQTLKLYRCQRLTVLPSSMQNLVNLIYLYIDGTALKEMPKGMGKLTRLQHLDYYIVGKHEENGIKELGGLSNLHGSLPISKLENVSNGSEALEAKMRDKKHISKLSLTWSSSDCCSESKIELDILCNLQPHKDLQLLEIKGYRGTLFPDWVGNPSYCNMTDITLSSCKNYCMLPSLGQLPSLKNLSISYMDALVTIDDGFYKNNDSSLLTPFPLLESLTFRHMPCWEVWSTIEPDAFPKLKILKIENCPKFRGDLPSHLPFLESLEFRNMPCWEVWSSTEPYAFPKLKCLKIVNCPKLRRDFPSHLPSLKELAIIRCTELASSLPRAPVIRSLCIHDSYKVALQELPLSLFPKQHIYKLLETLSITNSCDSLTSLPLETFPNLKDLSIAYCENLESLSASPECALQNLSSLEIHRCPNFVSFPREGLHSLESLKIDYSCDSLTSLPLETFPNLKKLSIANCENLESLSASPECALQNLSELLIKKCPNFVSFPSEGLHAPNMTSFVVLDCDKMNTLLPKLDYLLIENCLEIESFPEGGRICGPCDGMKSFPKEGLLPSCLTSLELYGFSSLETLDCKGLLHLTSLQSLTIDSCPKLENIAGERLPASLTKLHIIECPLLKEQCCQKHPQIWPIISHVHDIVVDGSPIW